MIILDREFGEVIVRKNPLSNGIKFSISTNGRLQMSVPKYSSNFLIKRFLDRNREAIREKLPVNDPKTQRARDAKAKILRNKAKEYLPYRLEYWSKRYGYTYDKLHFSHAGTRWGSCTHKSRGFGRDEEIVISLNIGLMNVPEKLRDYVILHELSHINHPDHSRAFWAEVEEHDPNYREHRRKLKSFSPGV